MGRTFIRQDEQIRRSEAYNDTIAPTEAAYETNPVYVQDDLNNIRSYLHELRDVRTSNWWEALAAPGTFPGEGAAARGVQNVNADLYLIERKRILKRRAVVGADIVVPSALSATGILNTDEKADFTDGQTFTLNDAVNPATTFEIDTDGGGVTPGNVQVDISGDVSKDDVRDTIIAAINGVGASLLITATNGGAATVNLQNANPGTVGNIAIIHNITAPEWTASGMSGGSGDVAILGVGELPGTAIAAIGASVRTGTVVAYNSTFGMATLAEVAGGDALTPKNLCKVANSATGEPILDGSGNEIHALLQYENNTDGTAITAITPNRAQLVFVVHNPTNDDLILCDPQYSGGQTIDYSPVERYAFEDIPEHAWLGDDFIDAGAASTTRQAVYANQGITPVELSTNAVLDLDTAGISWSIRDDANADLFKITEGSAGGTTTLQVGTDVDTLDVNAQVNDFDKGATFDSGGVDIRVGLDPIANTGTIDTLSGNDLRLMGTRELFLDDGNQAGSTWAQTNGIKLSDTMAEWDAFETAFGEVSLLSAIVAAQGSAARAKQHANVITANIPANTLIDGSVGAPNISAQMPSYKGLDFEDDVDIYINGLLQRPGANAGANNDVYPAGIAADQALGKFYCEYQLLWRAGVNPDVIIMSVYGTPTP